MSDNNKKEEKKKFLFLIEFEDEIISPNFIKRISKRHDIEGEQENYYIVINEMDESELQPYKNIKFCFKTRELRDERLQNLKDKLESVGYIQFL
jgi:hypothetical protein